MNTFVGREAELDLLLAAASEALVGAGRFVVVAGEAGIGKTRLGDEFVARARELGMRVAWVACWEDGARPALYPVLELCEQLGVAVEVAGRGDDSEMARDRLFAAVVAAVRDGCRLAIAWATHNTERFFEAARVWSHR